VRKRVSAPGKSVVTALPCAWEIAGETMWQPVPDLPLEVPRRSTVCRRTSLLRSRTRRSAPRLTNLGSPSRCGGLDPYWSGRPANRGATGDRAPDSELALTDSI